MTKRDRAVLALLLAGSDLKPLTRRMGLSYQAGTTRLLQLLRPLVTLPEVRDRILRNL